MTDNVERNEDGICSCADCLVKQRCQSSFKIQSQIGNSRESKKELTPLKWKTNMIRKVNMNLISERVENKAGVIEMITKSNKIWKQCSECARKFTSKVRLDHHFESIHVKKRSYNCKFCKSVFKFKPRLWKHTLKYHEKEDFTVNIIDEKQTSQQLTVQKVSIFHCIELLAESDRKAADNF